MKTFPVTAAMLLLLGGLFILLSGGWLFLAGVLMPLPHLSVILLAYAGCLLSFQGALHWGFSIAKPDIILPGDQKSEERQKVILGGGFFLWGWIALSVGLLCTPQAGYFFEGVGFIGGYSLERIVARRGWLPGGYPIVKAVFTALCVVGLLLALLSPQGRF